MQKYHLDIDICHISGIFTVPVSGTWRVTYSLESWVEIGESNSVWLYLNGRMLPESNHVTSSSSGIVASVGGRVVTLEASAGDSITLMTSQVERVYFRVYFCVELVSSN